MSEEFNLSDFDTYKEDNCREVKKAEGGLTLALWETYSSFANSNGGVIILGVGERSDGSGIPDIYQTWEDEGWVSPIVEESFHPDRTTLTLKFANKQSDKTSEQNKRTKQIPIIN